MRYAHLSKDHLQNTVQFMPSFEENILEFNHILPTQNKLLEISI